MYIIGYIMKSAWFGMLFCQGLLGEPSESDKGVFFFLYISFIETDCHGGHSGRGSGVFA